MYSSSSPIFDKTGKPKGNCYADLVLHALPEKDNYDRAVIITSDADFYSLVKYFYENNKLEMCSARISEHAPNF